MCDAFAAPLFWLSRLEVSSQLCEEESRDGEVQKSVDD